MLIDNRTAPYGIAILRITLGLVFAIHTYFKVYIVGIENTTAFFSSLGLSPYMAQFCIGLEAIGAVCLVFGIYARWIALVLISQMLGAIFYIHGSKGFFFSNAGGGWEYPAFCAITLFVLFLLGDGKGALLPSNKVSSPKLTMSIK